MRINNRIKNISSDIFLNLFGSSLPLVILQLVIYPIIARHVTADLYGKMQSMMALVYIISGTIGSALSTTRLVRAYDYKENQMVGDFNLLCSLCIVFIMFIIPSVIYVNYNSVDFMEYILLISVSILNFIVLYYQVGFRLAINYRYILYNKMLASIGYGLGFSAFVLISNWRYWQYIFIMALVLQCIHCLIYTDLFKEGLKKTNLFFSTFKNFIDLSLSSFFSKSLTYCDKFILYPLLGGEAVAIYFAGNVFGKLTLQILEPITNVMLSYLAQKKSVSYSVWKTVLCIGGFFCVCSYIIFINISYPILNFFYPQWANAAMELIPVCTLSLGFSTMLNIVNPLALKTIDTRKQVVVNGCGLFAYIILLCLLNDTYGLIGCCYALLLSYCLKLVLMLIYCFSKLAGGNNEYKNIK